jgi:hypothetical protein
LNPTSERRILTFGSGLENHDCPAQEFARQPAPLTRKSKEHLSP